MLRLEVLGKCNVFIAITVVAETRITRIKSSTIGHTLLSWREPCVLLINKRLAI